MKLEPTSYYVNNVVPLKDSAKEFLRLRNDEHDAATKKPSKCRSIQGGVLSDIRYSWLCRGPKLEVVHTKTGTKVAAWSFGNVLHDFETFITCVTELPSVQGKLPLLIIGLECEIGGGMICMFDINSSRVIRAIQIDDRVCVIHVVNPGCDTSFPGALRAMDGVLAVGTSSGKIVLIDLCRQICEEAIVNIGPDYVRDEINACHLTYLSFYDLNNLEIHKERSLNNGNHLALQINESSTSGVHFALHGPNGDVRLHANMEEVAISALHYCPQLGSLLVGFNFGAFQLYNLLNIRLEYTSPVYEDCIPITHFAIQEPCDDPRAFCYMWAVYNILENGDTGHPMAVMYALAYDTKDFLEGYGHLYQEFNSCSVRFQIELGAVPGFNLPPSGKGSNGCVGARCISLNSYTKAVVKHGMIQDVPDDKLALCSIVWIAWNQNITQTETYLTLFDLNQWYKEQMPSTTRLENDALSYMSCESLSELFALATEDVNANLLDVRLDKNTLSPFVCPQRLEEHYYPMALAFQAICIQDTSIVWLGNYGAQRHLLTQLEQAGPLRLLRPNDLFHRCISLGLTPQYTDVLYSVSSPLNVQREMILSVALEHQMVRWLCHCARDWSNGSQSMAGCTLDMLLDWAWQRANTLKFQSDKLCIPLFDHLGMKLDSNALLQLNHCTCQIKHLCVLFETVVLKCTRFLNEQDIDDIKYQMKALQMISVYLEVLQWLLNVGLLPECPLSMYPLPDESEKISAPYPVDSLVRFYEQRRTELSTKTGLIEGLNRGDLLFIDNLIDIECNGNILHKQWECDGGNGLYPPPSLQAVLRAYLIEDIDIMHKHCLLIYLFLDLAMTLDQSHYKAIITHLIKFPAVFKLSPSVIKITQAFWQLDHGDFSTAMTQLLDPSVNNDDLKPWHHRIVLKSLLLQGQHQHALLYQQVRKPPVSNVQDICIIITLLIVNDLLQEAFHFQRYNRTQFNEKQILKHLFSICEKMNQQSAILHLPLCPIEEAEFIEYLKTHPSENNNNFLVIYYLQRDRYGEAFQINDLLNSDEIFKQGLLGQHDNHFRNAIVNGFKKTLPEVTQQLLDYCKNQETQRNVTNVRQVKPPIPMSVLIHDNATQMQYKSTLIQASFQKAKELWKPETEGSISINNSPFVSTPKVFRFTAERNRNNCSMIYPAILETSTTMDQHLHLPEIDEEATPAKRMKLSPRRSININSSLEDNQQLNQFKKRLSSCNNSLLNTPIVKRRSIRSYNEPQQMDLDNGVDVARIGTPTSILKVRSFMKTHSKSPSPSPTPSEQENQIKIRETSITPTELSQVTAKAKKRTSFGITPRKSITRTPRPAVHFEERSNSRSSNESEHQNQSQEHLIQIDVHREQTPEVVIPSILPTNDSKNSSRSTDDTFYSPNSSINQSNDSANTSLVVDRSSLKRKSSDSISSRRSYKTSLTPQSIQNTSVRDSLSSKINEPTKETNIKIIITEPPQVEQVEQTEEIHEPLQEQEQEQQPSEIIKKKEDSPKLVARVSGRRSLSRQVLENNLFAKVVTTPTPPTTTTTTPSTRMSTRLSLAKLTPTPTTPTVSADKDKKCTGIEVSYSKSTTSIVKTITEDKIEEKCAVKITQIKDEFSSQTNENQIIKHVHNESETKSNVVKITEFIDEPNESENEEPIVEIEKEIEEIEPMQEDVQLEEDETSEEEKISNQDEDENHPEQIQDEINMDCDELKSEESEEEIELKQITSSSSSSSASSSASSTLNQDDNENINENSTPSSTSDVILVQSSSEHSNSDKQDEMEQEEQESSEENVQFDENTNEFQFHLEESIDDEPIVQQDEDDDDDENINENEDNLMKDINEDNTTDENNELFINKDIEEMEQVEIINEQQLETSRATQMLESIAEESTELNPLETNVINVSDATIHQTETEINESTIHPLEQNVIEITDTTIQQPEETIASLNDDSSNPLEKNVIEITDATIIQPDETTINPLEQNVLETPELPQTPARRTRSSSQTSETKVPKTPTRSSARRRSIDQKLLEETPEKPTSAKRITRKRSSVVEDSPKSEEPQITTRNRRISTSSSVINLEVIEEDKPMSRTRRATSVDPVPVPVPVIEKPRQRRGQSLEPESTTIKRGRKRTQPLETPDLQSIPEKIEEYSSTHRLTRHQKSIMEKSLIIQEKSRLQKLEEQDPIKLLDKESFTGSPDKEEGTYRANSPASSISTQTVDVDEANISPSTPTKRKRGRPSLNTPASAEKKSPGRPRRRSFTQAQQSIAATTPPRTRRTSRSHEDDTASVVSVSSVASVPVVQLKQLRETDVVRHRSLSPTALQEETQKSRRRSTRTNLSKISEESQVEVEKPRRGRRKTETEDAGTSSKRRSSYKPLANYLPEHAIVKTRKTFKIRKFSRGGSSP